MKILISIILFITINIYATERSVYFRIINNSVGDCNVGWVGAAPNGNRSSYGSANSFHGTTNVFHVTGYVDGEVSGADWPWSVAVFTNVTGESAATGPGKGMLIAWGNPFNIRYQDALTTFPDGYIRTFYVDPTVTARWRVVYDRPPTNSAFYTWWLTRKEGQPNTYGLTGGVTNQYTYTTQSKVEAYSPIAHMYTVKMADGQYQGRNFGYVSKSAWSSAPVSVDKGPLYVITDTSADEVEDPETRFPDGVPLSEQPVPSSGYGVDPNTNSSIAWNTNFTVIRTNAAGPWALEGTLEQSAAIAHSDMVLTIGGVQLIAEVTSNGFSAVLTNMDENLMPMATNMHDITNILSAIRDIETTNIQTMANLYTNQLQQSTNTAELSTNLNDNIATNLSTLISNTGPAFGMTNGDAYMMGFGTNLDYAIDMTSNMLNVATSSINISMSQPGQVVDSSFWRVRLFTGTTREITVNLNPFSDTQISTLIVWFRFAFMWMFIAMLMFFAYRTFFMTLRDWYKIQRSFQAMDFATPWTAVLGMASFIGSILVTISFFALVFGFFSNFPYWSRLSDSPFDAAHATGPIGQGVAMLFAVFPVVDVLQVTTAFVTYEWAVFGYYLLFGFRKSVIR